MEAYLKELCEDLNLDTELKTTESQGFLLPLTEALSIEVKMLHPGVLFFSPIAACPEMKKEELFIHLMKANLFGQGTLGGAIALTQDESLLTLSSAFPYEMRYSDFRDAIEDFANIVDYWRGAIKHHIEMAEGGIL